MFRKIIVAITLVLMVVISIFWEAITYGIGQTRGQIKIIQKSKPIEEVLKNEAFPDSLKQKIKIIQAIRKFAIDSIGLTDSDNYTTFYDQKNKTILWNLSACRPYSFTPKTWNFPFVGSFPYKGFFDLEKAKKEQDKLKQENFDTRIRAVGGWSTLGWFSDPILSNMLNRSEGKLANLIVHELTHSSLFVKDNIEFNENLASFIGERGAIQFLQPKYGKGSLEVEEYMLENADGKQFTNHMIYASSLLDSLYVSFDEFTPDSLKAIQKHLLIDAIVGSLDTVHFHNNRYYDMFKTGRPNNAYFMSFLRYHSAEDSLLAIFRNQYNRDLSLFIAGMKSYHED